MAVAQDAKSIPAGVWWGYGITVESQIGVGGVQSKLARMVPLDETRSDCWIRISQVRLGLGLGGGGDALFLVAANIPSVDEFRSVEIKGEGDWSLRFAELSSTEAKSAAKVVRLLGKSMDSKAIKRFLKFGVSNARHMQDHWEDWSVIHEALQAEFDALNHEPTLWTFSLGGIGFEAAAYYGFAGRVEVVDFSRIARYL